MSLNNVFSRPARAAARVTGKGEGAMAEIFERKRVGLRIEPILRLNRDARETFLLALAQLLRFVQTVLICVGDDDELITLAAQISAEVHGSTECIRVVDFAECSSADVILNVGTEIIRDVPSVTINSSGWVARLATHAASASSLAWERTEENAIGALAAACFGTAAVFLALLGQPFNLETELSLFTYQSGLPGTLPSGPSLPTEPLTLNAFLVGCGAVSNGWAYAVNRLPIVGEIDAIDKQSLLLENIGSYICGSRGTVDQTKASIIKKVLSPKIQVHDRADHWEFFKIRLEHGLKKPPLIISGLDNVSTRHSVQRLWPEALIDMGAEGFQSQVIVKHMNSSSLCLLRGLTVPPDEPSWADQLALLTGLRPDALIKDPVGPISQIDVDLATAEKKEELRAALGKPRCGFANLRSLNFEFSREDFAPAVPFVTTFTGVIGAGETLKWLLRTKDGDGSMHFQHSFMSGRSRALQLECYPKCECQQVAVACDSEFSLNPARRTGRERGQVPHSSWTIAGS